MEIEVLPCATPWLVDSQKYRLFVSLSRPTLRDLLQLGTGRERGYAFTLFRRGRQWHTGNEWNYPPRHVAALRVVPDILRRLLVDDIECSGMFPRLESLLSHEVFRREEGAFGKPCMVHVDLTRLEMQGVLTRRRWQRLTDYVVQLIMARSLLSGRPIDRSETAINKPRFAKKNYGHKYGEKHRSCRSPNADQIARAIEREATTPYRKSSRNGWRLYSARWLGPTKGSAFYIFPDLWVASIFMARGSYWPYPLPDDHAERFELEDPLRDRVFMDPSFTGLWRRSIDEDPAMTAGERGDDVVDLDRDE